jgi:O-antigen chain-terminating methyltransferase
MRLLRAERAIQSALHSRQSLETSYQEYEPQAPAKPRLDRPRFDYFAFEERFRGAISEIKRRHSIYLDFFLNRRNVLDLGCGRGEFVDLLSEKGVKVMGVDSSRDMVDFCRDRGLSVVLSDIFDYLGGLDDESVDGIFASQVIEHFGPEDALRLIRLCRKKLMSGGVIVFETVNPNCPEALSNFYLDPSHVRPVPAELLRFMLEEDQFVFDSYKLSSPVPGKGAPEMLELRSAFQQQQASSYYDYAVIAYRRKRVNG